MFRLTYINYYELLYDGQGSLKAFFLPCKKNLGWPTISKKVCISNRCRSWPIKNYYQLFTGRSEWPEVFFDPKNRFSIPKNPWFDTSYNPICKFTIYFAFSVILSHSALYVNFIPEFPCNRFAILYKIFLVQIFTTRGAIF